MKRVLLLTLLVAAVGLAQTQVNVQNVAPDCSIYFTLTAASPTSVVFDNRQSACTSWTITYLNVGGTFGALSLLVEQSADVSPLVWGAFAGSVVSGVNPNVAITQASTTLFGYAPWLRAKATVVGAGTITGRLYGFRQPSVTLIPGISSGGVLAIYSGCTHSLPFDTGAATLKELVPSVVGKLIRVCHISLSTTPAENVWISQSNATGLCSGGTVALSGTYLGITGFALDLNGSLLTNVGKALCLEQSVAQATGGIVSYEQY
jgi:hypothetical protein